MKKNKKIRKIYCLSPEAIDNLQKVAEQDGRSCSGWLDWWLKTYVSKEYLIRQKKEE